MKLIVSINRNPAEPLWKAHLEDEPGICAAGSFPVVAIGQLMIKLARANRGICFHFPDAHPDANPLQIP